MSKKIGVDTLIEGVETAKQFERLYAMGCKLYQGFYFSKPLIWRVLKSSGLIRLGGMI